jgi:hypothetical protein
MEAIKNVYNTHTTTPTAPPVRFRTDAKSLSFNDELLASHDYDLDSLVRSASGTTMDPLLVHKCSFLFDWGVLHSLSLDWGSVRCWAVDWFGGRLVLKLL